MKHLDVYINEQLGLFDKIKNKFNGRMTPKTKEELLKIIKSVIAKNGNECSLNHIDVSKITDMSNLFNKSEFNGDISKWDVSNVTDMRQMFAQSDFNKDISDWDVSNVTNMSYMFYKSKFNSDISNWDVYNVTNYDGMFERCPLDNRKEYQPKFNR